MKEYRCDACGFIYDPEQKINNGLYFKDIPESYLCPACKGPKKNFRSVGNEHQNVMGKFNKDSIGLGEN